MSITWKYFRLKNSSLILAAAMLVELCQLVLPQSALAQNQTGNPELNLSLSPPLTYLSLQPGETKSVQLNLRNSGSRNLQVQLQLADFSSDNLSGQPVLKLGSKFTYLKPRDPAWNWQKPQLLKSGESTKIWLDLAPPANAKVGEYHLTVLAQATAAADEVNNNQVSGDLGSQGIVTGMIGSNLVVAITTEQTNLSQLKLANWSAPAFVDSLGQINLNGLVENTGEHAGPIIGRASLIGPGGKVLKSWLLYPDMVLPNSTRIVRAIDTTQNPLAEPDFWLNQPNMEPVSKFNYQTSWLFGNYVFKIQIFKQSYTDAQPISEKTIQITAFPYRILITLAAVPMLLGLMTLIKNKFNGLIKKNLPIDHI